MARIFFAISVSGAIFFVLPGISQAVPIAPLSAATPHSADLVTQVRSHQDGREGYHREKSSSRRHAGFGRFGGLRSLMGMLSGGQGSGGIASMLGGAGGGGDLGGIASMLGGMAGSGGGSGGIASMLGGMSSGGTGDMAAMFSGRAGGLGGGASSGNAGQVSQSARQACTPDAMRLCSEYIPDVGKIKACMAAKSAQLSEPCRAAMNSEGSRLARAGNRAAGGSDHSRNFSSYGETARDATDGADHDFGGFQARQGFDRPDTGQGFGGGGGFDIGRMIGMARSFGFGQYGGW